MIGASCLTLEINELRCYEAKIEESEKASSRRELNPGHLWLEEKEHLMFTICACAFISKISKLILWVSQFFPCERCIPPTMLCVNNNEGVIKPRCSSVARFIHTFAQYYYMQWCNLSSSVIATNKMLQSVTLKQYNFWIQICCTRSIALQYGLSAGKLKFVKDLV